MAPRQKRPANQKPHLNELIEEPEFTAASAKIFGSAQQADVALHAITDTLAHEHDFSRYPDEGRLPIGRLRSIATDATPAFPRVVVLFVVKNTHQLLLADLMVKPMSTAEQTDADDEVG